MRPTKCSISAFARYGVHSQDHAATRRTLLFSATLRAGSSRLAKQYQQTGLSVDVAGDEGGHADIEYRAIRIAAGDVEHRRRQCAALL